MTDMPDSLFGMPIMWDRNVELGVMELRSADGEVQARVHFEPGHEVSDESQDAIEAIVAAAWEMLGE